MKKILKWLLIFLLAVIGLCAAVIVALPFLINPNDFKSEIAAAVQQHTGRVLTLTGDIKLSIFPWLGLQLGKARLSNAPGFGQTPMLQLDSIKLGVKLLPLLRHELQTDQTTLRGLQINLQRQVNGRNNWDDLLTATQASDAQATSAKPAAGTAAPLAALAIGGLQIENASIRWDDQQAKQHWQITNLDMSSGVIQWDKTFALKLSLSARAKHLEARSEIKFTTNVTLHQDKRLELEGLKLAQQLWYPQLSSAPLNLQASLEEAHLDLAKQTLTLKKLQLQNGALIIKADARAEKILAAPEYQAVIDIPLFNPRNWLAKHDITIPQDLPHAALSKLQAHVALKGNTHSLTFNQLDLRLDNSHLSGSASLPSLAPASYRYKLSLDKIDIDAYQPKTARKKIVATPTTGVAAATQLPMALLRSLDIQGQFNIEQLKVSNLNMTRIETKLNAHKGLLRLHPLRAQLYAGTYSGDLQLNAQGRQPSLSTNENLKAVALGPLLKDFMGDDKLHGTTNLQARLTTRGSDLTGMRQQLDGSIVADMKDGYLKDVDIDYAERKLRAQVKREPLPAKPEKLQTGFSKLEAVFRLRNGIAHTQTLTAQLPHARMQGGGDIDLVREQLNMTLNFKFTSDVQGQAGKAYSELDRIALPVHLRGPFTKLEYDIDFDAALKALLQKKIDKQKKEAKTRYEQKIQQEKQQLKEKLNQKADDFLKKLLNR